MKNLVFMIGLTLFVNAHAFQPVDINGASVEQLALLPGVGKKLAEKIVRARSLHRFNSIAALRLVDGMTQAKFSALSPYVTLKRSSVTMDPPASSPKTIACPLPAIPDLLALESEILRVQDLTPMHEDSLRARVRKAAWLPKIAAAIDLGHVDTATEKRLELRHDSMLLRSGKDVSFGIRASFDLDKLLYNDEELSVATLALKRQEKREEIIKRVHSLYFSYVKLAERTTHPQEEAAMQLIFNDMREAKAMLDSLSHGWFSTTQARLEGK